MGLRRNRAANYLKRLQIKAYLAIKKVKYEVLPGINGHIIISNPLFYQNSIFIP